MVRSRPHACGAGEVGSADVRAPLPALAQKVEAKDLAGLGALYGMFLHSDGLGALRTAFKDLMQASFLYGVESFSNVDVPLRNWWRTL